MSSLMSEAVSVARGEAPPRHSEREYVAEAVRWAARQGRADETPTETFARLAAARCVAVDVCYRAAAIARAFDDLDPRDLIPSDAPDAAERRAAWTDLLRLIEPHAFAGEPLSRTLRRLLRDNLAARALWLLILQTP
jgi:hypothetical protein